MKTKLLKKIRKRFRFANFNDCTEEPCHSEKVVLVDIKDKYTSEVFDSLKDAIIATMFILGYEYRVMIKRRRRL